MHSTGEKVQWMPVEATSTAVARATCSIRDGSQVAAIPSWVGKMVAPSQNECPWMQSSATSSGIRSRDSSASAPACRMRSGEACRMEPAYMSSIRCWTPSLAFSCSICPIFSGSVIRAIRSSTRAATDSRGSR